MKLQKHWYPGFIGIVGLYKHPVVLSYFKGNGSWGDLLNLLWFAWFLYLIPESQPKETE